MAQRITNHHSESMSIETMLPNLGTTGGGGGSGTTLLVSPSSLSSSIGDDCSSSRYSSLHDSAATASSHGATTTGNPSTGRCNAKSLQSAILDSFRVHWNQAWSIMEIRVKHEVTMDDLSSIVNHLEQMISLLVQDNSALSTSSASSSIQGSGPGSVSTSNHNNNINNNGSFVSDLKVCSLGSVDPSQSHAKQVQQALPNPNSATTATSSSSSSSSSSLSSLLDFMFSESILDKIYQWSELSGEWRCAMYLEQLKLYELLISQLVCPMITDDDLSLFRTPFVRPLIQLLNTLSVTLSRTSPASSPITINKPQSTSAPTLPSRPPPPQPQIINLVEIEKRLILLLNTLCVAISQNSRLLDLFLVRNDNYQRSDSSTSGGNGQSQSSPRFCANTINPEDSLLSYNCDYTTTTTTSTPTNTTTTTCPQESICLGPLGSDTQPVDQNRFSFPIFVLLIEFVHRDGAIGQQSRDALLLCLAQSRQDERLAYYIVKQTDFCPVLATGLSGLFSSLPRVLIGQQMSAEQFQCKDDLLHDSNEIEQFLKCLDFCNAVVQISHPIIQIQLLNFIYNGFLVSVIGPALYQDVANVSINDLESLSSYSNTLDEIITTTAYLDLFIRSISEPNLIRIFLEFLCFEVFDQKQILETLIERIHARSKLSLISLILFKTLLDLNCEDLLFQLIYKHLIRGKHLATLSSSKNRTGTFSTLSEQNCLEEENENETNEIVTTISNNHNYRQNWLAISGQKLFLNCLSYYLSSLSSSSATTTTNLLYGPLRTDSGSICSINSAVSYSGGSISSSNRSITTYDGPSVCDYPRQALPPPPPFASTMGHGNYLQNYLEYLNDAKLSIEQCLIATERWENLYNEPLLLEFNNDKMNDESENDSLVFSRMATVELSSSSTNGEEEEEEQEGDEFEDFQRFSYGFQLNNFYYDDRQRRIFYRENTGPTSSSLSSASIHHHNPNYSSTTAATNSPLIGHFLSTLMVRLDCFFENDILTNLHLTGLFTRLCHFNHRLLLSLFFDETLPRLKSVPCLLHQLQKLSLTAQNYCDDIANFELMFESAKSNLHSVPIGELNCHILTSSNNQQQQLQQQDFKERSNSQLSIGQKFSAFGSRSSKNSETTTNVSAKSISSSSSTSSSSLFSGAIKKFFRYSSNKVSHQLVNRRNSNASIASTSSHMVEVIPNCGVRFTKTQIKTPASNNNSNEMDKLTELIYNLIIFDEFLMELSAILTEQSICLL